MAIFCTFPCNSYSFARYSAWLERGSLVVVLHSSRTGALFSPVFTKRTDWDSQTIFQIGAKSTTFLGLQYYLGFEVVFFKASFYGVLSSLCTYVDSSCTEKYLAGKVKRYGQNLARFRNLEILFQRKAGVPWKAYAGSQRQPVTERHNPFLDKPASRF